MSTIFSGNINHIGSNNDFKYALNPPFFIETVKKRTITTSDSPIVVFGSAVGVLKNGFISIPCCPFKIIITNGNRNPHKFENIIKANSAAKNGTYFFLYFPKVVRNVFSIKL